MSHKVEISRYPVDPIVIMAAERVRMRRSYQYMPCSLMSTAANSSLQPLSGSFVFATQEEESTLTIAHQESPCGDNPALVKADKRFWAVFRIRHRNYGRKLLKLLK
jgi:hypothetical protein